MTDNWRDEPANAQVYFGNQKKRSEIEQRRPHVSSAKDLKDLGPALRLHCVKITDWNDILAQYDGYYSSDELAVNGPSNDEGWIAHVISDSTTSGTQTATGLVSGNTYRRTFTRNPADARAITWGKWDITTGVLLLEHGQTMADWFSAHPNLGVPVGTIVFEKRA